MSQYAFVVALPVVDLIDNEPAAIPARFRLTRQGEWWVVYSEPEPVMLPNGRGNVGRSPRRSDARKTLFLRLLASRLYGGEPFGAFAVLSEDVEFLAWAQAKATAKAWPTWTKAELVADEGPEATWLKANTDEEDRTAIRRKLAGMEGGALDQIDRGSIDGASPIDDGTGA